MPLPDHFVCPHLRLLFLFTPVSPSRLGFFLSTLILRHGEFVSVYCIKFAVESET